MLCFFECNRRGTRGTKLYPGQQIEDVDEVWGGSLVHSTTVLPTRTLGNRGKI